MTPAQDDDQLTDLPWTRAVMPSPEVSETICRKCTENLARKRWCGALARLSLSMGFTLGIVAFFLAVVGSDALAPRSVALVAGCILVQAALLFFGLGVRPTSRWPAKARWSLVLGVSAAVIAISAASVHGWLSPARFFFEGGHVAAAARCSVSAIIVGAATSACVLVAWLRTDAFTPRLSGLITGLSGGLVGATVVTAVCANHEGWHSLFGHVACVVALGLLGAFAGRRVLPP